MTDVQVRSGVAPEDRYARVRYVDYLQVRPGRLVASYDPGSREWVVEGMSAERVLSNDAITEYPGVSNANEPAAWLSMLVGVRYWPAPHEVAAPKAAGESELRSLMEEVLDDWFAASAHQSSMRQAAKHPYFQLLRRTGSLGIEMVTDRLQHDANPIWIWALGELTGEDPALGTSTTADATQAWLDWVHERSLD